MSRGDASYFAAELMERAQTAPDLASFRRDVLERLGRIVGCETYYWGEAPGVPDRDPVYASSIYALGRGPRNAFVRHTVSRSAKRRSPRW